MNQYMTLKEATMTWNSEQLRRRLLQLNDLMVDFEIYLCEELGEDRFINLCSGYIRKRLHAGVDESGMSEDERKLVEKYIDEDMNETAEIYELLKDTEA